MGDGGAAVSQKTAVCAVDVKADIARTHTGDDSGESMLVAYLIQKMTQVSYCLSYCWLVASCLQDVVLCLRIDSHAMMHANPCVGNRGRVPLMNKQALMVCGKKAGRE